jgi:hypothetical protein
MKHPLIISVISIFLVLCLASCQKSWNCACTKGAPSTYLQNDTKNQAITVCGNYESNIQSMYPNSTCSIE